MLRSRFSRERRANAQGPNHVAFFSLLMGSSRKNGRLGDPALPYLNSDLPSLSSDSFHVKARFRSLKIVLVLVVVLDLLGLCVETRPESSRTISFH
jgi:hypothetical protein